VIARPAQRRRSCRFLLSSLIGLLLCFPFLESLALPLILVIPVAGVFVVGVATVEAGRVQVRRALVLAAIQTGLTLVSLVLVASHTAYLVAVSLALLAMVALMLFAIYCVLGYVLRARVITRDQIYAGICMYLMLGFAFGAIYYLINILEPKSFVMSKELLAVRDTPDLMYFSFVTLATLGYGDITPRTDIARLAAVMEALAGMLYIAVFMARLVSLRSADDNRD
jgi:hypothetical protein